MNGKSASRAAQRPAGHLLGPKFVVPARATYATRPEDSRGRYWPEEESATRTCFQRDRDRIVHSAAFRRLKHKTQVFVQHEGDYYRTRLTHSLEVAQITRSFARVLGLDEDLAEALALAHDLGHPPFGHAGETALNECMKTFGGFDHNTQALALVTRLEKRYANFDGLNLTWEMLEGLVKHNGPLKPPVPEAIAAFNAQWDLELVSQAGPEAQIAALSDDIAYVNHDLDDGLRAGLFAVEDLFDVPLAGPVFREVWRQHPNLELGRLIGEAVRRLITILINDVAGEARKRIAAAKPESAGDIRALPAPVAAFSEPALGQLKALKEFLYARMYRHERVLLVIRRAQAAVCELFEAYLANPSLLPADWAAACGAPCDPRTARVVCDYMAGMTDSFVADGYARAFNKALSL
ncbi:MAG: deoxyguanosinetriphosphate triphosphohydrolase [Alphaproteobacteria bacterium]